MLVCEEVYRKEFVAHKTKDAYLDACKWVSSNVIAVNNSEHITYKIVKQEYGKVLLILYATAEEQEIKEQHCGVCKEVNSHFYMKENVYMCYTCRMNPYRERMQNKLKKIIEGMKGRFL